VLASPAWFWKSAGVRLAPGDTVAVRGSKSLGADGRLYIVAQSISFRDSQPALLLRDVRGMPLWRGNHGGAACGAAGAAAELDRSLSSRRSQTGYPAA